MANMSLKKNPMPSQDPNVRNKNFDEVALGYTEEQALDEAQRCLHCKNKPCMQDCPVMVHIPAFIAEVAKGDFEAAYQIIAATSALPAVCARLRFFQILTFSSVWKRRSRLIRITSPSVIIRFFIAQPYPPLGLIHKKIVFFPYSQRGRRSDHASNRRADLNFADIASQTLGSQER